MSDLKPLHVRWIVEMIHRIISNTNIILLSKVSMLQGSARLSSHVQTINIFTRVTLSMKTLSMKRDNNRIFSSFFCFFSWKHNLIWSFESFIFLAKYTSHCSFFDYRYGSKGSNNVKTKKGIYFRKSNFGGKFRRWKIFVGWKFPSVINFVG